MALQYHHSTKSYILYVLTGVGSLKLNIHLFVEGTPVQDFLSKTGLYSSTLNAKFRVQKGNQTVAYWSLR